MRPRQAIVPNLRPHYLRASLITSGLVLVLPTIFLAWSWWELSSPGWDTNGDSGAAQGFGLFCVASALALLTAAVLFPLIARLLERQNVLTPWRFRIGVLAVLWLVAVTTFGLLSRALGGLSITILLVLATFTALLAAALVLPFSKVWLRIALKPHNRPMQPTAGSGG